MEYEVLPAVLDLEEASKPGATQVHARGNVLKSEGHEGSLYSRGDVQQGFKQADVIVEGVFSTATQLHNSLETHGSVASWEGDELTIWESTQYIFGVRDRVSQALEMPLSKIRVICDYMGGGFGSKGQTLKQPVICAILAKMTRRPVKLMLTRQEENTLAGNRGATIQKIKVGAKKDGTITAIDIELLYGLGAYGAWAGEVGGPSKELYKCENVRTLTLGVRTNTGSHAAFRAPGYVEGTFSLESLIDELCEKLEIDPLDYRKMNYAPIDQGTGQEYSSKHLLESYDRAMELLGMPANSKLPKRGTLPSSGSWKRGIGMASQTWGGGGGPPAHAVVRFNSDGTVEVLAGSQDIGTGTKTAFAQIAAEELGVPLELIWVRVGDTQKVPFGPASWGSITTPSVGPAVRMAAADACKQLLEISSFFMELPAAYLTIDDGYVSVEGRKEGRRPIKSILDEIGDYMITGKGYRGPNPNQQVKPGAFKLRRLK